MIRWLALDCPDSVQVIPIEDLIQHEYSVDCACGPKVEPTTGVPLVTHNSLDGRELIYG